MKSVPGGANYWDLGLSEGYAKLYFFASCDEGHEEKRILVPIPEETMSKLEELLGDGQATVTVGKDFKISENYQTAGSSCFVKLTCNQDLETVLKTREVATTLAVAFAEQGFEQAQYTLDKICGREATAPPPLVIESEEDPEPNRKQVPAKKSKRPTLPGKPKFKR